MLRVYCDSNIYRLIKPEHPYHSPQLLETFESLKDKMLFTFSDAHLFDLKNSVKLFAEKDLKVIERYVKDNFFSHDFIKKTTEPFMATPIEAYSIKDFYTYEKVIKNPFDLENLFKNLDVFKENEALEDLIKYYFNLPISAFLTNNLMPKFDQNSQILLNKIFPNNNLNITLSEFLKSVGLNSNSLIKNENELTELRKYIKTYMNRDEYSFDKWGLQFDIKMKKTSLRKSFSELVESLLTEEQKKIFIKNLFMHIICLKYIILLKKGQARN